MPSRRLARVCALTDVRAVPRVLQAACGARHSLALTATGRLLAWGWGKYGQLGMGGSFPLTSSSNSGTSGSRQCCDTVQQHSTTADCRSTGLAAEFEPVEMPLPGGLRATAVAAGWWHTLVLAEEVAAMLPLAIVL
jgi:alpha-tubulin suppressor-like RCC1 family protein